MSSSFFLKKDPNTKKRKKNQQPAPGKSRGGSKGATVAPVTKKKRALKDDEEIPSDNDEFPSDVESEGEATKLTFSSDEGAEETPQDKRLRLAKEYLKEIERQEEELELHDHVSKRLRSEYLDSVGKLRRNIADTIENYDVDSIVTLKHPKHHLSTCSMALTKNNEFLFTGAKSQFVLKWNLKTCKVEGFFDVQSYTGDKNNTINRRSNVIAMCLSSDTKFLALADGGKNIQIWCPNTLKHLKTLTGHRDIVTCLVFRKDSHDLYSGSRDRGVKIWSIAEMAYVESLFGHQAGVTSIDVLSRERPLTAGGNDNSLRIWKIEEESQLVYNAARGNIELVKYINDEHFISATIDGSLCLWSALKKKPQCVETEVHGKQSNGEANWITALACVSNTDLVATGSCNGYIRLWKAASNSRKLTPVLEIPMTGFVNNLTFNSDGTKLYAAVGQEHRLGRWWRIKEAKNKIVVIDLPQRSAKEMAP